MQNQQIKEIRIKGFKSIKEIELKLNPINILVGANGSGKSNLISFFKFLRAFSDSHLATYTEKNGGAGDILYNGRKHTDILAFLIDFSEQKIATALQPTLNNSFVQATNIIFSEERNDEVFQDLAYPEKAFWSDGLSIQGNDESFDSLFADIQKHIHAIQVYHFHDTSETSGMRHYEIVQHHEYLESDASNIAPFLLSLKNEYPQHYNDIINAIRLVTPFFEDFFLKARTIGNKEEVNLSWKQKDSDYPMQPYHFSDGTLRFISLATALLQPNPPRTIIIDEPELGLHPAAINILAELIQSASQRTQVLIATQSSLLLDQFSVEDIIVAKRRENASTFERLSRDELALWLEDYSLGELLTKNIIQGGPSHE